MKLLNNIIIYTLIAIILWLLLNQYSYSYYNRVAIERLLITQNFNSMYMIQQESGISPLGKWRGTDELQLLDYKRCKKLVKEKAPWRSK